MDVRDDGSGEHDAATVRVRTSATRRRIAAFCDAGTVMQTRHLSHPHDASARGGAQGGRGETSSETARVGDDKG